jgi:hypothetical protein
MEDDVSVPATAVVEAQMVLTLGFKRTTLGLMVGGFTVSGGPAFLAYIARCAPVS